MGRGESYFATVGRAILLCSALNLSSCAPSNIAYHDTETVPLVRPLGAGFYVILDAKASKRILQEALAQAGENHQIFVELKRELVSAEVSRLFSEMRLCPAGFVITRLSQLDKSPNYEITTACK